MGNSRVCVISKETRFLNFYHHLLYNLPSDFSKQDTEMYFIRKGFE